MKCPRASWQVADQQTWTRGREHANRVLPGWVWETQQKGERVQQWTAVIRLAAWRHSEWMPGSALTPALSLPL